MSKLIEQIKRCRVNRKMSIEELAEKTGISEGYLLDLENRKNTNPTLDILEKIEEALNMELTFIYKE